MARWISSPVVTRPPIVLSRFTNSPDKSTTSRSENVIFKGVDSLLLSGPETRESHVLTFDDALKHNYFNLHDDENAQRCQQLLKRRRLDLLSANSHPDQAPRGKLPAAIRRSVQEGADVGGGGLWNLANGPSATHSFQSTEGWSCLPEGLGYPMPLGCMNPLSETPISM